MMKITQLCHLYEGLLVLHTLYLLRYLWQRHDHTFEGSSAYPRRIAKELEWKIAFVPCAAHAAPLVKWQGILLIMKTIDQCVAVRRGLVQTRHLSFDLEAEEREGFDMY